MSKQLEIRSIEALDHKLCHELIKASVVEGYDFVQKLCDEYQSGKNRFDEDGAILLGGYLDDRLVTIGGVHPDPYLKSASIGRIRHLYVLPVYRRRNLGRTLTLALIQHARSHFEILTLRTLTEHGDKFYKSLGFTDKVRFENATHWLSLETEDMQ